MRRTNPIKKHQPAGMSLLEVMVSFSILIVVFVALAQTFPLSSAINKTAENATEASFIAQAMIEELNSINYENIPPGVIEGKHRLSNDPANYLYYFQRQAAASYVDGNLQVIGVDGGLKKITITIYCTDALSKTEKTYTTVFLIAQL